MFSDAKFHVEMFPQTWHLQLILYEYSHGKRRFRQCNVKSVKNISRRNENNRTPTKKAPDFFGSCAEISIFQTSLTKSKSFTTV